MLNLILCVCVCAHANFGGVSTFLWPNLKLPQVYHLAYLINKQLRSSLELLRGGCHIPHQTFALSACCLHQILPSLHSFLFAFFLSFQQVYSCILIITKNKTNTKKPKQTDKPKNTPKLHHGKRRNIGESCVVHQPSFFHCVQG